jgi:hypothetical protein
MVVSWVNIFELETGAMMKTKFKGHQSFSMREGWLYKGLKGVSEKPELFLTIENAMDSLGLGSNMVMSLRYWLPTLGLSEEINQGTNKGQSLTDFGKNVLANDIHFQRIGTLLICHYNLVSNFEKATSWYFFFNEYSQKEFSKEDFFLSLQSWATSLTNIAPSSLASDVDCLLKTYLDEEKNTDFEDLKGSPFSLLGLVKRDWDRTDIFFKSPIEINLIPSLIAMYMILKQIEIKNKTVKELNLSELLEDKQSIGLILNLRVDFLVSLLERLVQEGYLNYIHTSGLEMIKVVNHKLTSELCLEGYYKGLKV